MVIRFSVKNFRSIKENVTLDFVSSSHIPSDVCHTYRFGRLKLIKNLGIFGANASGKSTLVEALKAMRSFVLKGVLPENLAFKGQEGKPTEFEIVFEKEGRFFQYSFAVKLNPTIHLPVIVHESLYELFLQGKNALIYDSNQGIATKDDPDLETFEKGYRNTVGQLFLSYIVAPERLIPSSKSSADFALVYGYFLRNLFVCMGDNEMLFSISEEGVERIKDRLHDYDTGIESVSFGLVNRDEQIRLFSDPLVKNQVVGALLRDLSTEGNVYYCDGEEVFVFQKSNHDIRVRKLLFKHAGIQEMLQFKEESAGTKVVFLLISTLLTQDNSNRTLFIDEIERSSHPHVVRRIIEDFQSANQGNKAQLVFTSFLGSLMDEVLKRDEVYFVEKDDFGLTHLRSLSEYSSSNRRESIQKRYYEGRFGALPKLSVRIKDHAAD